jgi:hypothetical protein
MKAVEFETTMTQEGQIHLPVEFLTDIPSGQHLKVVVMWDSESADSSFRATGRMRFEEAYCAEDSVYENLLNEAPAL